MPVPHQQRQCAKVYCTRFFMPNSPTQKYCPSHVSRNSEYKRQWQYAKRHGLPFIRQTLGKRLCEICGTDISGYYKEFTRCTNLDCLDAPRIKEVRMCKRCNVLAAIRPSIYCES